MPSPTQVPAQAAVVPHIARPLTGAVPFAVFVHVPGVASQRVHWPLQSELQQYPSLQKPSVHCVPAVQVRPAGRVVKQEVPLQ